MRRKRIGIRKNQKTVFFQFHKKQQHNISIMLLNKTKERSVTQSSLHMERQVSVCYLKNTGRDEQPKINSVCSLRLIDVNSPIFVL